MGLQKDYEIIKKKTKQIQHSQPDNISDASINNDIIILINRFRKTPFISFSLWFNILTFDTTVFILRFVMFLLLSLFTTCNTKVECDFFKSIVNILMDNTLLLRKARKCLKGNNCCGCEVVLYSKGIYRYVCFENLNNFEPSCRTGLYAAGSTVVDCSIPGFRRYSCWYFTSVQMRTCF